MSEETIYGVIRLHDQQTILIEYVHTVLYPRFWLPSVQYVPQSNLDI